MVDNKSFILGLVSVYLYDDILFCLDMVIRCLVWIMCCEDLFFLIGYGCCMVFDVVCCLDSWYCCFRGFYCFISCNFRLCRCIFFFVYFFLGKLIKEGVRINVELKFELGIYFVGSEGMV